MNWKHNHQGKDVWNASCWEGNAPLTLTALFLTCSQWPWMGFGASRGTCLWEAWCQDSRAEIVHSPKPSTTRGMEGWEVRPWTLDSHGHHNKWPRAKNLSWVGLPGLLLSGHTLSSWDSSSPAKQHTSTDTREFTPRLTRLFSLLLMHKRFLYTARPSGRNHVLSFLLNVMKGRWGQVSCLRPFVSPYSWHMSMWCALQKTSRAHPHFPSVVCHISATEYGRDRALDTGAMHS